MQLFVYYIEQFALMDEVSSYMSCRCGQTEVKPTCLQKHFLPVKMQFLKLILN